MTSSLRPHDPPDQIARADQKPLGGVLFSMCLALVLVVASVSAINLALPALAVGLGATNSDLTWIADSYTVALAALVLPLGALGDRLGRRKVLIAGAFVFGAASLAASFATTPGWLIVGRIVMGIGAAMIMPGTLSTITGAFPPERRARGVATWSGFAAAGAIIGLLAAGALLEVWGWQSIFVGSAVVALAAGACAWWLAPETKEHEHGRFDFGGALGLVALVGGMVFAIIEGSERGWTSTPTMVAAALAVAGLVGYVAIGLRHEHPLLDPRLFGLRGFRAGGITIVVQFMAVFGFFFVGLQYLQLVLAYSPLLAAVALVPVAVVVLPTAQATPWITRRLGLTPVMGGGLLCLAAGMLWISTLEVGSGYMPFLGGLLLSGLGIGLTSSTGTSAIVSSLPADKQGVASAMNDASREVGAAIGVALMGSVYGSTYRNALPEAPANLPAEAVEMIRHSAAAGIEVAKKVGEQGGALKQFGDQLALAVRTAFMDGLSASLIAVAVIVGVAAVAVLVRGPRGRAQAARPLPAEHELV